MDDGEQNKNVEEEPPRQLVSSMFDVCIVFQSFWVRCRSIFPDITDRKFMESKLRFVLCCGVVFWAIYLFAKII